jgi:hypothetical protein
MDQVQKSSNPTFFQFSFFDSAKNHDLILVEKLQLCVCALHIFSVYFSVVIFPRKPVEIRLDCHVPY